MSKIFTFGFWNSVARLILRNRIIIILLILATTVFFASQWKNMRFSFTEANLLPDDHEVNQEYNAFLEKFGEEGNLIVMGIKDSSLFTEKNYQAWKALNDSLQKFPEVDYAISIGNLKKLENLKIPSASRWFLLLLKPILIVLSWQITKTNSLPNSRSTKTWYTVRILIPFSLLYTSIKQL